MTKLPPSPTPHDGGQLHRDEDTTHRMADRQPHRRAQAAASWQWPRQTIAETFARIVQDPAHPWVAIGDFLDDWRSSPRDERFALIEHGLEADSLPPDGERTARERTGAQHLTQESEAQRWAVFCAAMVEWLCRQDDAPFPAWTSNPGYRLAMPWFLYPGDALKPWELATTPAPFKARNIFGGDQILDRV